MGTLVVMTRWEDPARTLTSLWSWWDEVADRTGVVLDVSMSWYHQEALLDLAEALSAALDAPVLLAGELPASLSGTAPTFYGPRLDPLESASGPLPFVARGKVWAARARTSREESARGVGVALLVTQPELANKAGLVPSTATPSTTTPATLTPGTVSLGGEVVLELTPSRSGTDSLELLVRRLRPLVPAFPDLVALPAAVRVDPNGLTTLEAATLALVEASSDVTDAPRYHALDVLTFLVASLDREGLEAFYTLLVDHPRAPLYPVLLAARTLAQ